MALFSIKFIHAERVQLEGSEINGFTNSHAIDFIQCEALDLFAEIFVLDHLGVQQISFSGH